jgi:hypothetical protein
MLIPVQQTPIPLDPARQQLTPPPPPEPPPPPMPSEMPLQAADTPQDHFDPQYGDHRGNDQSAAQDEQVREAAAAALRNAYMRLASLELEASRAVQAGNADRARDVAAEAADLAEYIRVFTNTLPVSTVAIAEPQQHGISSPPAVVLQVQAALDTARVGLGTAKSVIDTAASLPHHPLSDRLTIDNMRQQVLAAMAGVEVIAAKFAAALPSPPLPTRQLDIRA